LKKKKNTHRQLPPDQLKGHHGLESQGCGVTFVRKIEKKGNKLLRAGLEHQEELIKNRKYAAGGTISRTKWRATFREKNF